MENIYGNLINRSSAQAQPNFFFITLWNTPFRGCCLDVLREETECGQTMSQASLKLSENCWEMDQIWGVIGSL